MALLFIQAQRFFVLVVTPPPHSPTLRPANRQATVVALARSRNSGMAAAAQSGLRPKTCRAPACTSCAPIKLGFDSAQPPALLLRMSPEKAQPHQGKQWLVFPLKSALFR
jgi:hypothetical protein